MKIFRRILSPLNVSLLQRDLISLEEGFRMNGLTMNPDKCKILSYHRIRSSLGFDNMLNGIIIPRVESISDLGVLHVSSLSFTKHVNKVTVKALSLLGFIRQSTIDFFTRDGAATLQDISCPAPDLCLGYLVPLLPYTFQILGKCTTPSPAYVICESWAANELS